MLDCNLYPTVCREQNVPSSAEKYPHYGILPAGKKDPGVVGEIIFSAGDMETHVGLPLIAKVIKAALKSQKVADSAVGLRKFFKVLCQSRHAAAQST